jgi:hypothetical protein
LGTVVLLVIAGLVNDLVLKPRQPVAKVGTTEISTEAFQKRVKYKYLRIVQQLNQLDQQRAQFASDPALSSWTQQIEQQMTQLQSQLSNPPLVGKDTLDEMITEELIRQEAARRSITVSAEEVTTFIEHEFGFYRVPPTPTPTRPPLPTPSVPVTYTPEPTRTPVPSPTPMSESAYNTAYQDYLTGLARQTEMTQDDFRRLVESQLYQDKLQKAFAAQVPADAEQIKLRYIMFETDTAATAASPLVSADAATFDKFYNDVKDGKVISTTQGETGWMVTQDLYQQFESRVVTQLLSLSISQTTGVITNVFGSSYAFQLTGRETRPLTDAQKQPKEQKAFQDWLDTQRLTPGLVDYLGDRYAELTPKFSFTQAR